MYLGTNTDCYVSGISLKGNTYWVATDKRKTQAGYTEFSLMFDFSVERFRNLSHPAHTFPLKEGCGFISG